MTAAVAARPKLSADRHELVLKHLGYAVSVGKSIAGPRLPHEDIQGASFLGLVEAAARDDGVRPFKGYAAAWVKKYVAEAVADSRRVNLPSRARRAKDPRSGDGYELTLRAALQTRSLDSPDPDSGLRLSGLIADRERDAGLEPDELPRLAECLGHLTDAERDAIGRRFGLGGRPRETLTSIGGGTKAGATKADDTVRRAIWKLRKMYGVEA